MIDYTQTLLLPQRHRVCFDKSLTQLVQHKKKVTRVQK